MVPMLPCSVFDEDGEGTELDEDEGAVTEGVDEEDSSLLLGFSISDEDEDTF